MRAEKKRKEIKDSFELIMFGCWCLGDEWTWTISRQIPGAREREERGKTSCATQDRQTGNYTHAFTPPTVPQIDYSNNK